MKNLKLSLALALACTAISSQAMASEWGVSKKFTPKLGFETYTETYREYGQGGSLLMQEEASMRAFNFGLEHRLSASSQLEYDLTYAFGDSTYTGAYWGQPYGTAKQSGIDRTMFNAGVTYKLDPAAWNGTNVFAGVNYRKLTDDLQEMTGGYKRINDMVYLTIGAQHTFNTGYGWQIVPSAAIKPMLYGNQYSDLYGGVDAKQKKGYGAELAVKFIQKNASGIGFEMEPYYRMWDIKDSEYVEVAPGVGLYEPANKTKEIGVKMTVRF